MTPRLNDLAALAPPIRRLREQRDRLAAEVGSLREELTAERARWADGGSAEPAYSLYPPGHFYSPQADLDDVRERADALFDRSGEPSGVDVDLPGQLEHLARLEPFLREWPYAGGGSGPDGQPRRYQPDNGFFGWTDSQTWYAMLRLHQPAKVIEVGSGWSTALLLDTVDEHDLPTTVTTIDPYPERLLSTLRDRDAERVEIVQERVQSVEPSVLADLRAGDVLFIDSTHVSKVGSDVNHLFFEVIPRLPAGVHVHVHDIAYPFEYPLEWVLEGRSWNEAYLLRALLTGNERLGVSLWPSMLFLREEDRFRAAVHPKTPVDGGSLWLLTR